MISFTKLTNVIFIQEGIDCHEVNVHVANYALDFFKLFASIMRQQFTEGFFGIGTTPAATTTGDFVIAVTVDNGLSSATPFIIASLATLVCLEHDLVVVKPVTVLGSLSFLAQANLKVNL